MHKHRGIFLNSRQFHSIACAIMSYLKYCWFRTVSEIIQQELNLCVITLWLSLHNILRAYWCILFNIGAHQFSLILYYVQLLGILVHTGPYWCIPPGHICSFQAISFSYLFQNVLQSSYILCCHTVSGINLRILVKSASSRWHNGAYPCALIAHWYAPLCHICTALNCVA